MPKAKKQLSDFTFVPEVMTVQGRAIVVGMRAQGVLFFEDFPKESEGNKYDIPLKARSLDGATLYDVTAEDYEEQDLLTNPSGEQLYVNRDMTLTTDPWLPDGRTLKATAIAIPKQASSKTSKRLKVLNSEIVWPDGKMRAIRVDVKANNPQLPSEFLASRAAAGAARTQATATRIDPAKLEQRQFDELMLKTLMENARRKNIPFECPQELQYLQAERSSVASQQQHAGTQTQPGA